MDYEDEDLDILTALMAENGDEEDKEEQQVDDLEDLFDEDGEEEYDEGQDVKPEDELSELFGDVDDIEKEEQAAEEDKGKANESLCMSQAELQDELRRMQEKMQALQKQLEASQSTSSSSSPGKPSPPRQTAAKRSSDEPTAVTQKMKTQSEISSSNPVGGPNKKVQESSDFLSELSSADSFKRKPRVAHQTKSSTSPEARLPLVEIKMGSSFLAVESTSKAVAPQRSSTTFQRRPCPTSSAGPPKLDSLPKDVAMEKYSGLRLRKPRVSSSDMDRKMADRRLIRLSQVPDRLQREKLEDSDWVTFGVLVSKATPQSSKSGKTFSIWKLNDLHNLDVFVSLLLFSEVHKEHWKTEPGTVIGILNPNSMKQKEGYSGVSLTVDHPQKLLLMGQAQDYGTCKAMKKNGEPCAQLVNMYECQYCQYHIKAQYKKMSSNRSELQSSYSGKAPNKVKGVSLRERICQDGFHYGGVSSAACAASLSASRPKKKGQATLDKLFVRGSARHILEAKMLAMKSGEVSNCSDEFKSLMSVPSAGALQLKKHLTKGRTAVSKDLEGAPVQPISASDLLKQQKQKQREFLLNRQRRAVGVQQGTVPKSTTSSLLTSPKAAPGVPKATQSPATPQTPTLARGFSKGEDVLFFEGSPPPSPAADTLSLSAAKLAALKKLRARGMALEREDPNDVKRKWARSSEISARVEKNLNSPDAALDDSDVEPAEKRKRDELSYIQSEEFQKILNAKSLHGAVLQAAEYQLQEQYFDRLVKKEQMEEKMKSIREMKCRAVSCKKCNYTYFKPADRCVGENHPLHWHDAIKRFFKCPCGQRAIALDRLPHKHCSNCGLFKWERDGMLKEKTGPKIGAELLKPRGEEHGRFLNSLK
ncbi:protein MCM10 homolog [Syngnathoides biaculeatus]|uniref:protein MCM10 homolog n=1 Tax=Syngnathoides biaculeatus TaxID=300417 RepID=UPI002ADD899C|nr:protein MCM10 homolog [Syngnathoides biaculeatus]